MKKLLIVIAVIAVVMTSSLAVVPFTTAMAMELNGDEYDQVFIETVNELGAENYVGGLEISASKELVYDMHLDTLGYLYDFTINGETGYAILINGNGYIEVVEIFFDAEQPYSNLEEDSQRVYVATMVYLVYTEGNFYLEGEPLTSEELAILEEKAYYSMGELTRANELVYYVSKSEDKFDIVKRHPTISTSGETIDTCGTNAGANLIQYWDRFKTNLIPNFNPGTAIGTNYLYNTSASLSTVVDQLYYDMGAPANGGITIDEFMGGINTYCTRQGYTATFTSLMASNGAFSYSNVKQAFAQNLPVVLFLDQFSFVTINESEGTDTLAKYIGEVTHTMVGFGYRDITYTLSNGTRVDKYIAVATGRDECPKGYMNINENNVIDAVYSLTVV